MRATETLKADYFRERSGFYTRFMQGSGLDVGHMGYGGDNDPVLPTAIGVDTGYPGYDGFRLPFPDESQDFVYSSHCLEHLTEDPAKVIAEWFRVVKVGGHLIIAVPHQFLYEKRFCLPSKFASPKSVHVRFYRPSTLLYDIETALRPNTYRVAHLSDADDNYDYTRGPEEEPRTETERYEIECVLRKLQKPAWEMAA